MCEVVGIEHDYSVVLAGQRPQLLQHPLDGIAFTAQVAVGTYTGIHAVLPHDRSGIIRTVVTDDKYIVQFLGIIKLLQVLHQSANHFFLVVCGDQYGK